jgi:hypothetical protein
VALIISVSLLVSVVGCKKESAAPTPEDRFKIDNDSIVLGEVLAIREMSGGAYTELDLRVIKSVDVPEVKKNLTKDKVGKILTVITQDSVMGLLTGEIIVCYVTVKTEGQQTFYFARNPFPGKLPEDESR